MHLAYQALFLGLAGREFAAMTAVGSMPGSGPWQVNPSMSEAVRPATPSARRPSRLF